MKVRARATVCVTLQICPKDVWSADTKVDQIDKQARESVRGIIAKLLATPEAALVEEVTPEDICLGRVYLDVDD